MGLIADAYQRMQATLLPPGRLWALVSSLLSDVLLGAGDELARLDARVDDLLNEDDPSTAVELLADYESELALSSDGTTAQRQARIVARLVARQRYRPIDFQTAIAPILGQTQYQWDLLSITGDWNVSGSVGASSVNSFAGDGWMQWKAKGVYGDNNWYLLGLSHADATTQYSGVQYGIMLRQDTGHVVIYENGGAVFDTGAGWAAGDLFKVQRVGSTITYYKNGTLLYTSATPSSATLLIDTAFLAGNGSVGGIRMFDNGNPVALAWQNVVNVTPTIASTAVVLERTHAFADSLGDDREIFRFFVYRDPTLPGSYSIADAQALIDAIKPSHTAGYAIESTSFLYDDPHSLYDRDLLGA